MLKAVNIKEYMFGSGAAHRYFGFAILDTESNEFISFDGKSPYVLPKKKVIQSCIDAGWVDELPRVAYTKTWKEWLRNG